MMEQTEGAPHKSKRFAVRIIRLYQTLCSRHQEQDLFLPLLRAGAGIGNDLAEADCAVSKKDMLIKTYAALKACVSTAYWLELLCETEYLAPHEYKSLADDCEELRKLLVTATRTLQAGLSG